MSTVIRCLTIRIGVASALLLLLLLLFRDRPITHVISEHQAPNHQRHRKVWRKEGKEEKGGWTVVGGAPTRIHPSSLSGEINRGNGRFCCWNRYVPASFGAEKKASAITQRKKKTDNKDEANTNTNNTNDANDNYDRLGNKDSSADR